MKTDINKIKQLQHIDVGFFNQHAQTDLHFKGTTTTTLPRIAIENELLNNNNIQMFVCMNILYVCSSVPPSAS